MPSPNTKLSFEAFDNESRPARTNLGALVLPSSVTRLSCSGATGARLARDLAVEDQVQATFLAPNARDSQSQLRLLFRGRNGRAASAFRMWQQLAVARRLHAVSSSDQPAARCAPRDCLRPSVSQLGIGPRRIERRCACSRENSARFCELGPMARPTAANSCCPARALQSFRPRPPREICGVAR